MFEGPEAPDWGRLATDDIQLLPAEWNLDQEMQSRFENPCIARSGVTASRRL